MKRVPVSLQDALQFPTTDMVMPKPVDAGVRLTRDHVWMELPQLRLRPEAIAKSGIVTISRSDPAHIVFDMLRTRVLQTMRRNGWTSIAITSPTPGCGASLVAANLAFSLAHQKDCRTLLIDLNLKHPGIDKLVGMTDPPSMEMFLEGNCDLTGIFRRYDENLAIAANNWPVKFSAELLQSHRATKVLQDMQQTMNPEVILYDLPPMLSCDDVTAFLPNVDCAILVVAAEQSTFDEVDACERELAEKTNLLGVVLNKCQYGPGY
jgi:Mrp family chromosome partitioning ATPase